MAGNEPDAVWPADRILTLPQCAELVTASEDPAMTTQQAQAVPQYWHLVRPATQLGDYQGVHMAGDETPGRLCARVGEERVPAVVLERGSALISKWGRRDTYEAPSSDVTTAAPHIVTLLAERCT